MTEIDDLITAVRDLQATATDLCVRSDVQDKVLNRLEKLTEDTDKAARATRKNTIGLRIGTAGIVLSLVGVLFSLYLFVRVDSNAQQIQDVQNRTSSEILCPLFQVIALSISANPVLPNYTEQQQATRQRVADAVLSALGKLHCPAS